MRIGILGSTGPAGSALGARLASVGYEVVLGSRSKERGTEVRDELVAKWPDLKLPLFGGMTCQDKTARIIGKTSVLHKRFSGAFNRTEAV